MSKTSIPATLVSGFLDAGKTTYILDCLRNDFFYKRGHTLLFSFEEGDVPYDSALLEQKNTTLVCYPGTGDIIAILMDAVTQFSPDRIYVEMNTMIPDLYEAIAFVFPIKFSITLIEGTTFPVYFTNMRQWIQDMVKQSHQVIFHHMDKAELATYGNAFRVMNEKAIYLWEGPTGYHEKAFGVLVPYDLEADSLALSDRDFTPFYLDALEAPSHYDGKEISLLCQISSLESSLGTSSMLWVGRQVMTCCMADIQFLSIRCQCELDVVLKCYDWIFLKAKGELACNRYGQKTLLLKAYEIMPAKAPKELVLGIS